MPMRANLLGVLICMHIPLASSPGLPRPKLQLWSLVRGSPGQFYSGIIAYDGHDRHLTSVRVYSIDAWLPRISHKSLWHSEICQDERQAVWEPCSVCLSAVTVPSMRLFNVTSWLSLALLPPVKPRL